MERVAQPMLDVHCASFQKYCKQHFRAASAGLSSELVPSPRGPRKSRSKPLDTAACFCSTVA
eukprot:12348851-Alexandrium_andersonii.AAC.1